MRPQLWAAAWSASPGVRCIDGTHLVPARRRPHRRLPLQDAGPRLWSRQRHLRRGGPGGRWRPGGGGGRVRRCGLRGPRHRARLLPLERGAAAAGGPAPHPRRRVSRRSTGATSSRRWRRSSPAGTPLSGVRRADRRTAAARGADARCWTAIASARWWCRSTTSATASPGVRPADLGATRVASLRWPGGETDRVVTTYAEIDGTRGRAVEQLGAPRAGRPRGLRRGAARVRVGMPMTVALR